MLLPDDLIIRKNCSKEMIRLHKKLVDPSLPQKSRKKNSFKMGNFIN